MQYTVIIEKGRESGFIAFCPTLRGCVTQARTKISVIKKIKEAIRDYIECLVEDGLPVPTELGKEIIELEIVAK